MMAISFLFTRFTPEIVNVYPGVYLIRGCMNLCTTAVSEEPNRHNRNIDTPG